ncbi:MAG: phage tail protein I [Alphaproteobacteria bacterium]|jgi:phage tail P2-like protein|nr:phage tail protein I [Alphaproteobacteria bacterium]
MDSLLPPNATELQKDFEKVAFRIGEEEILSKYLLNPNECPEYLLPWLAWTLSVDVWNDKWAVEIRRKVIKESLSIHRSKGTIGALKQALKTFGFSDVKIEEWFNYGGEPYHFRAFLEVMTAGFDLTKLNEIYLIIKNAKNVRSHLEKLSIYLTTRSNNPKSAICSFMGETTEILPLTAEEIKINKRFCRKAAFLTDDITTIYPRKKS